MCTEAQKCACTGVTCQASHHILSPTRTGMSLSPTSTLALVRYLLLALTVSSSGEDVQYRFGDALPVPGHTSDVAAGGLQSVAYICPHRIVEDDYRYQLTPLASKLQLETGVAACEARRNVTSVDARLVVVNCMPPNSSTYEYITSMRAALSPESNEVSPHSTCPRASIVL